MNVMEIIAVQFKIKSVVSEKKIHKKMMYFDIVRNLLVVELNIVLSFKKKAQKNSYFFLLKSSLKNGRTRHNLVHNLYNSILDVQSNPI